MANENQNGNAAAKKSFAARMKEKVAELEKENAHLKEQLELLSVEIDSEAEARSRQRIMEKDRYVAKCEEEAEARLANSQVIINALNADKARLSKRVAELEQQVSRLSGSKNKGFLARLLGK